jgi:hypothetical protein
MENPEINDTSENKVRSIFMGTFFTILVLLISLSYGMIWGILFIIFTKRDDNFDSNCDTLISWDKALYIVQFISAGLHLISSIFQLIATSYDRESSIPKYIMGFRSCLVYISGMTILLGISVSYGNLPSNTKCGDLLKLNLAYIITEWTILFSCIFLVCIVCIISIIFKKRKRNENNRM